MKNGLNHANEYVRGSTLRFLCSLKEPEILESLIPYVTANLEHRHSYVRKTAALAVYTIYEAFHDTLIPDAPDLIEKFIHNVSGCCRAERLWTLCRACTRPVVPTTPHTLHHTGGWLPRTAQRNG
jgi:coatomer subunit beta